jgi:hypothetical protein
VLKKRKNVFNEEDSHKMYRSMSYMLMLIAIRKYNAKRVTIALEP